MHIREILKNNPLVLAPMAGITDFPFRLICRELGAGLVYSEMLSVEALVREHRRTRAMLHTDERERPVVFQIFGSRPEAMAEAARVISRSRADFIDINMGCPVPKILRSGSGSALLRDLGLAKEILAAVAGAATVPVLVKIRAGWDSKSIVAVELAQAAEAAGLAAVTVHGRTRVQGFSGQADWTWIREVKQAVSIPVIGNGDVRSATDAKRMLELTGCDGVMIGRAVQGNPWIFREARQFLAGDTVPPPPTLEERQAVMLRHLRDMVAQSGETIGVREMRKHLCWYTKGLPAGAEFREHANHLADMRSVEQALIGYFHSLAGRTVQHETGTMTR